MASESQSALQDNIARKGKNAYYFAHAHKATGPQWDGKVEPKLLSSTKAASTQLRSSFEYTKSNITTYAFLDDGIHVKLYIDMEGVGSKCTDKDIALTHTPTSLCLRVTGYDDQVQCLSFAKLTAPISQATCKKKPNKLILTLVKQQEGEWHTINDKGTPDHEIV